MNSDLLFAHMKGSIDENSLSGRLMIRMSDTTEATLFKFYLQDSLKQGTFKMTKNDSVPFQSTKISEFLFFIYYFL